MNMMNITKKRLQKKKKKKKKKKKQKHKHDQYNRFTMTKFDLLL